MLCCCSLSGINACKNYRNNPFQDYNKEYIYINFDIKNPKDEKEIVTPIIQYWCNNCDSLLNPYQKYCHNCGKEIDWSNIFCNE